MGERELRILFVEDMIEDAELEELQLRQGGIAFTSLRVEDRENLIRSLDQFKPDLVISDFSLPRLDGFEALKLVLERSPGVPFIFVSGTLGEERAVSSLKQGASDYVVKGRLDGLVFAVERALKEARERAEHRLLEEQFRQSQKMEAIGRLAGGVAHDFNNLLTVIIGYSELALARIPAKEPLRGDLEEIERAGRRAAGLTRQLLAFSRKQAVQAVSLDLNAVVSEAERMLGRLLGDDVRLALSLAPDLWKVNADAGLIEQVIMNLVVNARDAMPKGGCVALETRNVRLDEVYVRAHSDSKPGPHVLLSVSDTGTGMTPEVVSHLFEPFYTTKERGRGTGLGLPTVHGIVKQAGGSIEFETEPGRGTTFKVYLPRAEKETSKRAVRNVSAGAIGGTETILLVEDQEGVRRFVAMILRESGYKVLQAQDGPEALELCRSHEGQIHLLLTDMVMPTMSGEELARRVAQSIPQIRILFMSGYTDRAVDDRGLLATGAAFLQKPFTKDELQSKLRELLDAGRRTDS